MSNNKLDDIFKAGLKDAKVTPPDHVWARIQASGVVQPAQNRSVIIMTTVRWAAAAVVALLMTAGGFWLFQKESASPGNMPIAEENVIPIEKKEVQEEKSKINLENNADDSEYALESDNSSKHPEVTPANNKSSKGNYKSKDKNEVLQKSFAPEQIPLHQKEEIQYAEIELIIPAQKLETTGPQFVKSQNAVSNSELASADAIAKKDVALKFSVDPNALIYAADQLGRERTMRERLFDKAGEKMTELAEAAGLPVRRWSKIKEVEILY